MRKFHILSSVALAFSLFFTLGSAATQAQNGSEFAGGNGTEANPWQIATKKQLAAVNNYVGGAGKGKYFILTKDLEFTAEDFSTFGDFYNNGQFWKPIGIDDNWSGFCGNFDGGNHEIRGLKSNGIDIFGASESGLFHYLYNASVKNLKVSYENIKVGKFGGISPECGSSVIDNCHVSGEFSIGGGDHFGGIIGLYNSDAPSYVINCSFIGNVKKLEESGYGGHIGGIAGRSGGYDNLLTIADSFVEANIDGGKGTIEGSSGTFVGGMLGEGKSIIQNCYVKGNISGTGSVGGLIGSTEVPGSRVDTTISQSYFRGKVTGGQYAGGLIGFEFDTYDYGCVDRISGSYSEGEVRINNGNGGDSDIIAAGGLVGRCWITLSITDSYSHCDVLVSSTKNTSVGGLVGCCYWGNLDVQRSYAMGTIKGDQTLQASVSGNHAYVGGLTGYTKDASSVFIQKSVAMNPNLTAPHGDKEDTGRIIGGADKCNLEKNYALDTMTLKISNKDVTVTGTANDKNGLAQTASALSKRSTYTDLDWDFDSTWKMSMNGYPILAWQEDTPLPVVPTITTQPKSQTVNVGSSVTFSVVATGTEPLSYQWKKNGSNISGATASTYKINSVQTGDAGSYTVTVSNSAGSVTSSAATLTVNVPVTLSSITINGSSSVNVGSTTTYTCTATYSNGTTKTVTPTWAISAGSSYASITSGGVLTGKAAGTATIQARYGEGSVTKTVTKNVTVNAVVVKPSITTQPKSQTVTEGSSATFSVVATGTTPLSYQWKKNGSNISGATKSSYTISSTKTSDAGSYTVTVSNSAGSVTSSAATLTVNAAAVMPKIITQPKSQTVNEGSSVTFSVVAEGGDSGGNADFSIPLSNSVNLDMVWIEPGTFMMGSPEGEIGWRYDEPVHQVTLTKGFWTGKYEVTQAQYKVIMGTNPSQNNGVGDNYPVYFVNWYDAMEFCERLTEIERKAGRLPSEYEYTLPTEAQWEYACRAGTTTALNSGKNLSDEYECPEMDEVGWYMYNCNGTTHPVGQKKPNAWGLYDMHGNVWEWCLDWYGDYPTSSVTDPQGPSTGSDHVIRGGALFDYAGCCRSAGQRWYYYPAYSFGQIGIRVALVPVQAQASAAADTLTYQWYKDGIAISGATGSNYTINSVKTSDAGKYTVRVCNSAGCVTSSAATLTVNAAVVKPTITTQPKSQTVNEGSSATFSVTATGTAPLSYQWKKNGSNISGATSSTYRISSAKTSDAGSYTVTVSNSAGSVTSSAATLTVNVPVTLSSITINGNSSVNVGSTATYTCTATYSNGTTKTVTPTWSISSGTSYASITSGGVLTGKAAGTATVKATYEGKTATKNVTVNAVKPTITTQPKSQTVNEGNSVTFSVVATGTAPLSYQWYKDGKAISGATGSSYTISSAKSSDAGSYYVIVSNTAGSVTSNTVTLTVILKPVITSQPRSLVVDEDDPATFSVVATGTAPLSYQWYKDGRAISGATGSSYTISSAKKSDEGSYYVIVRNNAGSVTSNTVTLTVNKLEPDGTAIRSISINGLTATVTLTVVPNKAVNVYFVEENIPAIGTIIPNDGGVYTPAKNVIRWSFLDNASRVVSYTVTVPNYLDKVVYVNGTVTFDTNVRAITGDNELDFTLKTHPADTNENFEITTPEVSLYAVAWKLGQSWSREPSDIPMSYVSRAALIWVNGGDYIYDASKAKPFCWVNAMASAASEEEPSVSTTERTVSMDEGKANVSIEIVPAEGISVYLVEEQLSADVTLNVTDISDGGNYIPEKNVIRWTFLDGTPRTLTYTLEPEEGFVGKVTLNGEVMFDEETFTIEGDTEAFFRPIIHFVMEDDGKTLILNFTGTLYESEDTVTWTEVEGAESPFIVDTTKGKKFYRCVK